MFTPLRCSILSLVEKSLIHYVLSGHILMWKSVLVCWLSILQTDALPSPDPVTSRLASHRDTSEKSLIAHPRLCSCSREEIQTIPLNVHGCHSAYTERVETALSGDQLYWPFIDAPNMFCQPRLEAMLRPIPPIHVIYGRFLVEQEENTENFIGKQSKSSAKCSWCMEAFLTSSLVWFDRPNWIIIIVSRCSVACIISRI